MSVVSRPSSCATLGTHCRSGIVSGHVDNHIRFWDSRSGECTNELTGVHTGQITCLNLSEGTRGAKMETL